ncbi:MAG: hypothetical protein Q4G42_01655 [Neisseria sp.]|nr:hypothetical protein [Neisseria sp.]
MKKLLMLLVVAVFLSGCQSVAGDAAAAQAVLAKVTQPEERTVAYFDQDWALSAQPDPNGFYRKVYGKTADGHYIAQDFYASSQTKQTDPFEVIAEAGLTVGDNSYNTGTIVWYDVNGTKTGKQVYQNGLYTGEMESYYPNGKVKFRSELAADRQGKVVTAFYENGQAMSVVRKDQCDDWIDMRTWYDNGQQSGELTFSGDLVAKGWDRNGKALPEDALGEHFALIFVDVVAIEPEIY